MVLVFLLSNVLQAYNVIFINFLLFEFKLELINLKIQTFFLLCTIK